MSEPIELWRIRQDVAGPDGLVIVAAGLHPPASLDVEFWFIPLNDWLAPLEQRLLMSDTSDQFALSVMRDVGLRELDHLYADVYGRRFPALPPPSALKNAEVSWELPRQLWLRRLTGDHLERIQAATKCKELAARLKAITSLTRPVIAEL